jgi:hypothetical protein
MALQADIYRGQLPTTTQAQFDELCNALNTLFGTEHNEDGTHSDITVASVTFSNGISLAASGAVVELDGPIRVQGDASVVGDIVVVGDVAVTGDVEAGTFTESDFASGVGYWTAYTPSWVSTGTQPSLGTGGTLVGRYTRIGKTGLFRALLTLGTGFSFGTGTMGISLPAAALATAGYDCGWKLLLGDTGTANYYGTTLPASIGGNIVAQLTTLGASGAIAGLTTTAPFTWVATDTMAVSGVIEFS